jgi:hypothetical protein
MVSFYLNIIYKNSRNHEYTNLFITIYSFIYCEITVLLLLFNRTYSSNKYILCNLYITIMKGNFDNGNQLMDETKTNKPIIFTTKNSDFQLSLSSQLSSTNITNVKDERLELVEISKGLIEILQDAGFTVERILENGPSHIAAILGIDDYVAQIIFSETKKTISNLTSDC